MRTTVTALAVLLGLAGTAQAQNPIADFFRYKPSPPPVAGNCAAIAADIGPEATWYGQFIGMRYDDFVDGYSRYFAAGCFRDKASCWIFQERAVTYLDRGWIIGTRCVIGAPIRNAG
jgi:hypothetical protein